MKVTILTSSTTREGEASQYTDRLARLQVEATTLDADSREGTSYRELYDLAGSPAITVTQDDGKLIEKWEHNWPAPEDISYLYHS